MSRKRSFFLGVLSGTFSNIVATIIGIFSVPIGVRYFGVEKYGALAVISTILTYLSTSQLGLPSAVNVLASKAIDRLEQLKIIMKAFVISLCIVFIVAAGFIIYTKTDRWLDVIGRVPSSIYIEVARATFISAILFLLNLPLTLFLGGFVAGQKIHIERFYNMMNSSVIPFLGLLMAIWLKGNLVLYAWVKGILTIVTSLVSIVHIFFFERENRKYLKSFSRLLEKSSIDEFSTQSILGTSFRFFIVGLAATVVWHTDNLIISHFFGVKNVTPYAITFKLITSGFFIFSVITYPIFPMVARAYSSGEINWIKETYEKLIFLLPLLGGFIWVSAVAFARDIIYIWVGPEGYAGLLTVFAIGGYGYACSLLATPNMIATGLNFINVFIGWSEAIVNVFLSILFVKYFKMGIGGTALGTFLASILTVSWMVPMYIRRRSQGKIILSYQSVRKTFFLIILPCLIMVLIFNNWKVHPFTRIFSNLIIIGIYIYLSYRMMPQDVKKILLDIKNKFCEKFSARNENGVKKDG